MEDDMSREAAAANKPKANKPVKEFSDGPIKVSVWRSEGEHGPRYSVTCRRRYKDKAADEWKDSYSYGQDDILALAKLLDLAHTWMLEQQQQQRAQKAA
jgi:hypothetical protein